jgi:hypothetical protein
MTQHYPLRLAVRCPSCRRSPPFRVSTEERDASLSQDPDRAIMSYECRCGERYLITIRAFQYAA